MIRVLQPLTLVVDMVTSNAVRANLTCWMVALGMATAFLSATAGCSASPASTATSPISASPQTKLITKSASDLQLQIKDFPIGWMLNSEGQKDDGYDSKTFLERMGSIGYPLVSQIKVFTSVEDAKEEYRKKLSDAEKKYPTKSQRIGDEAFAYAEQGGFRCLFRKSNVIGIADMSTELYGGSIEDVVKWATELAKRVS